MYPPRPAARSLTPRMRIPRLRIPSVQLLSVQISSAQIVRTRILFARILSPILTPILTAVLLAFLFAFLLAILLAPIPFIGVAHADVRVITPMATLAPGAIIATALPPGFVMDARGQLPPIEAGGGPQPALPVFPNHPGWPTNVVGGASPPVCADLDPAYPGLETVVGTLSSGPNLYAFHQDGTLMSGYPLSLGTFVAASAAVGDINGDGQPEIVAGDFGGNRVWALHTNGTPLPGWPIAVGANVRSTAALADLDPSVPGLEVIVGVQDGTVQAWHGDGTNVPGWPVMAGNFVERCSPAVGDVDGDGNLEVFVGSWYDYHAGSTGGIYAFDHTGAPLPGWPQLTNHTSVIASAVLADLDGDGRKEVIAGTYESNARMFVWRYDGTLFPGWPYTIPRGASSGSYVSSSPAVADLDGDGNLEIVDGTCGQCGTVYAWHRDGTVVTGWPFLANNVIDGSSPVIGDVDGDGRLEIVVGSGSGFTPYGCTTAISKAYILHADGTLLPGWPFDLGTATPPYPALADLDGDGLIEVVLAFAQTVYAWDAPGAYDARVIPWAYYHLGIDHTGDFAFSGNSSVDRPPSFGSRVTGGALLACPNPRVGPGLVYLRSSAPDGVEPPETDRLGSDPSDVDQSEVDRSGVDRSGVGRSGADWSDVNRSDVNRFDVRFEVFDSGGRLVRSLAGPIWDCRDAGGRPVPGGIYFVRSIGDGGQGRARIVVTE